MEREISFRTEAGLYFSYYKQIVLAPSFFKGKMKNSIFTGNPAWVTCGTNAEISMVGVKISALTSEVRP